ncbi:MAG: hypothetical protein IKJ91_03315 [Clostridia bacterium]|nr:hypothetical protein [Clostridia bacterium]
MKLLDLLWEFIYARMTEEQYRDSHRLFENDERLLLFLCFSYNAFEVLYGTGTMSLITNPKDLFISREEISAFLEEYKKFIRTVINEEQENAADTNNRTN